MAEEIVNRVAQSKLQVFDLEDYYPVGKRVVLDIKDWLWQELILKEKDFRILADTHDWQQYKDTYVALNCSTDAIVPSWAYMLLVSKLQPYAKQVVVGSLEDLETSLYQTILSNLDVSTFQDKPVIIKGCSHKPVPQNAYLQAMLKIQPVAKSVMYGEACSAVPLYKKK
ncbi:DUF2480 family protein [Flavobacterium sp. ASW18X]|uniref:DUF2480 family protein n=1 Tax=Flavobacterium sp. ASW18X TaxID=2572595 RepID=UPI0010AE1574|nr:DUF2480 family protein [Flavobacterium sp. ASW18X]TKD65016.1 DUF2480 family protein [Flavobacterium sp. ASW18X]